jgi:cyclohexanone monooxygenase
MPGVMTQSVTTANLMHVMLENCAHVTYIIDQVRRRGFRSFEVSAAAEQGWVRTILDRAVDRTAWLADCTPGRNNDEGRSDLRPVQDINFGGGALEMFEILGAWRERGDLSGLALERDPTTLRTPRRRSPESRCPGGGSAARRSA